MIKDSGFDPQTGAVTASVRSISSSQKSSADVDLCENTAAAVLESDQRS